MSRREFREAVDAPRPISALVMGAIANASLAVTGQIAPPVLAVALASLVVATLLRERPGSWQRSSLVLNVGLAAAVGVSAALFVRGALVMVALSHFAMLAQSLQLLDARPRRSEFLLVAVALFQVVLAANLTDSVFFPLLLVAFTITTIWTLVVHTLRAEAIEAHEPDAARAAISAGLMRPIMLASLTAVLIALLVFPLLPRLRAGSLASGGIASSRGVSGFSDRVELGDVGSIRLDPRVALRVETLAGDAPPAAESYLRGLALDHFDGRLWSITPPGRRRIPGDVDNGIRIAPEPRRRVRGDRLVQRIAREPLDTGVLFAAGRPLTVRGALGRIERDAAGSLHSNQTADARIDYEIASEVMHVSDDELARDRAIAPADDGGRHLALPDLPDSIARLAREITADAGSDAERVRAIENWLRSHGRYTDQPPHVPRGSAESPLVVFLEGDLAGHCEYFASSMAVLARTLGIPTRIVTGFAGGAANPLGGFIEYAQSDAHSWVEVHFEDAGWIAYDPTPPDLRMAGAAALRGGALEGARALASAIELWWFRNVVDFDRGQQTRAIRALWERWQRLRGPGTPANDGTTLGRTPNAGGFSLAGGLAWRVLLGIGLLAGGAAAVLIVRARETAPRPPQTYRRALRWLARRGLVRSPFTSARAFAGDARAELPCAAADAFERLTESYLRQRFGDSAADPEDDAAALEALRRALA